MTLSPEKYFIIVPNMFGNGLSSSPSNTPPPLDGPRFPKVSRLTCSAYRQQRLLLRQCACALQRFHAPIKCRSHQLVVYTPACVVQIAVQDNVNAQHRLVTEKFGITSLVAVLGWSMGAGQTFQWAVRSAPGYFHGLGVSHHTICQHQSWLARINACDLHAGACSDCTSVSILQARAGGLQAGLHTAHARMAAQHIEDLCVLLQLSRDGAKDPALLWLSSHEPSQQGQPPLLALLHKWMPHRRTPLH